MGDVSPVSARLTSAFGVLSGALRSVSKSRCQEGRSKPGEQTVPDPMSAGAMRLVRDLSDDGGASGCESQVSGSLEAESQAESCSAGRVRGKLSRCLEDTKRCSLNSQRSLRRMDSRIAKASPKNFLLRGIEVDDEEEGSPAARQRLLDVVMSLVIVSNFLLVGVKVEHIASSLTTDFPQVLKALDIAFFVFFSVDILLRVFKNPAVAFRGSMRIGTIFDTLVVFCDFLELVLDISYMQLLALLRLPRLFRIARLFKSVEFLSHQNLVIAAVLASGKFLLSTCCMLLVLMFMVGVVFCQAVAVHRIGSIDAAVPQGLSYWWGSLGRSMLSLFEAICGGCDWDELLAPLFDVSPMLVLVFLLYIAFLLIAVMNIITGIFVDSAIRQTVRAKDVLFSKHLRSLYTDLCGDSKWISRQNFFHSMTQTKSKQYLRESGLDLYDVAALFDLLDEEDAGMVSADAFIDGIVRLRTGTKFLDILALLSQIETAMDAIGEDIDNVYTTLVSRSGGSDSAQAVDGEVPLERTPSPARKAGRWKSTIFFKQRQSADDLGLLTNT
eukprot:TRINITY_DN35622_c0_g1_i2.p1 TRINITY_DN35622_c0_g1~~TRINITY_DN35622_c0_g1_i2.p1  ORF type:complete len:554 (+),score=97.71 TRINITY_DN35622_c0_g1_i2:190-1851(+)